MQRAHHRSEQPTKKEDTILSPATLTETHTRTHNTHREHTQTHIHKHTYTTHQHTHTHKKTHPHPHTPASTKIVQTTCITFITSKPSCFLAVPFEEGGFKSCERSFEIFAFNVPVYTQYTYECVRAREYECPHTRTHHIDTHRCGSSWPCSSVYDVFHLAVL